MKFRILSDEELKVFEEDLKHFLIANGIDGSSWEKINKEDGVTVLCSLHFLDLVHRYADRAIALNDGVLMFDGPPNKIDDEKVREIYGKDAERVG